MGGGSRLAIAILILFLAMVCFFFAFHPGGVQGVSDPNTMLQWLMGEFQNTASGNTLTPGQIANIPGSNTPDVPGVNQPSSQSSNAPPAV